MSIQSGTRLGFHEILAAIGAWSTAVAVRNC